MVSLSEVSLSDVFYRELVGDPVVRIGKVRSPDAASLINGSDSKPRSSPRHPQTPFFDIKTHAQRYNHITPTVSLSHLVKVSILSGVSQTVGIQPRREAPQKHWIDATMASADSALSTRRQHNSSSLPNVKPYNFDPQTNQTPSESAVGMPQDADAPMDRTRAAATAKTFPLMKLPPELRLETYHYVFIDLTENRQRPVADLSVYREPEEWPNNELSTYVNLLVTCKEVNNEVKDLWEKHYASQCCLYFWQVPKLYDTAQALRRLGEPYTNMQYVLRTPQINKELEVADLMVTMEDETDLMTIQPGFPIDDDDFRSFFFDHYIVPPFHGFQGSMLTFLRVDGVTYPRDPTGGLSRIDYPGLERCEISVHQQDLWTGGFGDISHYAQMTGKFSALFWGHYDAAIAYGKMRIYDEYVRRFKEARRKNHPFDPDIIRPGLARWWKEESVKDQKWLDLGGQPWADVVDLARDHGMFDWMDIAEIVYLMNGERMRRYR